MTKSIWPPEHTASCIVIDLWLVPAASSLSLCAPCTPEPGRYIFKQILEKLFHSFDAHILFHLLSYTRIICTDTHTMKGTQRTQRWQFRYYSNPWLSSAVAVSCGRTECVWRKPHTNCYVEAEIWAKIDHKHMTVFADEWNLNRHRWMYLPAAQCVRPTSSIIFFFIIKRIRMRANRLNSKH